jgi:hypothetical protein
VSDTSEALILAVLAHMVRTEKLTADDIDDIATTLDGEGETEAAHLCRCTFIEGIAPKHSDWEADQRRSRFHIIANPDGGKQGA